MNCTGIRTTARGKLAAVIAVVYMSGCVPLAAGVAGAAGASVWTANKLVREVNVPLTKVHRAAKEALTSLDLGIIRETIEGDSVRITSEYYEGEPIWIDLDAVSEARTEIGVRVGVPGDEEASRTIMSAIERNARS